MGAVGVGLVDCHCHLSAPDFDHVREGEVGPVGAGRPPVLYPSSYPPMGRSSTRNVNVFYLLHWKPEASIRERRGGSVLADTSRDVTLKLGKKDKAVGAWW